MRSVSEVTVTVEGQYDSPGYETDKVCNMYSSKDSRHSGKV